MAPGDVAEMAIPSYLHWNPAVRWIIRERLRVIARRLRDKGVGSYLDFGCGVGVLVEEMSPRCRQIYAADLFLGPVRKMVALRGLKNVCLVESDNLAGEIPEGSLDGIVAADVLEHVDDVGPYLDRFSRWLKPGGVFFLSGPTESAPYKLARFIAGFNGDCHHRDVFAIEADLRARGWTEIGLDQIPVWSPFKLFRVTLWRRPG